MQINNKQFTYLLLSLLTMLVGYAYLRFAYKVSDTFPFTQEIVLILLGTIVTIFITALLLNKQTAVEIEKEQNIKYLELKTNTYEKLLNLLEEMSLMESFSKKELVNLKFITHRLAIIASPSVLKEYQSFLQVINTLSADNSFVGDSDQLHCAISSLTLKIRNDLIGLPQNSQLSSKAIEKIILDNSKNQSNGSNLT